MNTLAPGEGALRAPEPGGRYIIIYLAAKAATEVETEALGAGAILEIVDRKMAMC